MITGLVGLIASQLFTTEVAAQSGHLLPETTPGQVRRMDDRGHVISASRDMQMPRSAPTGQQAHLVAADWKALGPFGGDVSDVKASPSNPNIVLAGIAGSSGGGTLFRSTNAGSSWSEVTTFTNSSVHDVEFAPDGTAYVGTFDSVWKSTDGGATWTQSNLGIGIQDQVLEVTIDPNNPLRIWIGVADAQGSQPNLVLLSTDGATTFTSRTPPVSISCTAITVVPGNSNKVYAGFAGFTGGGGVWFSNDAGLTWSDRSSSLPGTPIGDLAHDGSRVLVSGGQLFGSQFFGLFQSTNEGLTWTAIHDALWPNLVINDIAIDASNPANILVGSAGSGVYRSTNAGLTWSFGVGGTNGFSVNGVSFVPGSSSSAYLGGASVAVWKTTDNFATFVGSSTGIGSLDVYSIASNPLNANELAIAFQGQNNGGVYTSTNKGASWTLENSLPGTRYSHVRFSPQGQLYAISSGPTTVGAEGLYVRSGLSWSSIGPNQGPVFESELASLRVSAVNPSLIVAVGADFGAAGFEHTVWRTTNGGGTWTKVVEGPTSKPVQDVRIVDAGTEQIWIAPFVDYNGPQQGGVLRSTNNGVTWTVVNTGLPTLIQPFSVAISEVGPRTLYISNQANGSSPVFESINDGVSWTSTGGSGVADQVETDVNDPNVLYICRFQTPTVQVSVDGGVTFSAYNTGLATAGYVRELLRATGAGSDLLAATTTGGYSTATEDGGTPYCFGDGSGTACPCGNSGAAGNGCANSLNPAGANLTASGTPSISNDTIVLFGTGMTNQTCLYFQGLTQLAGGNGVAFGDGLRCVGSTIVRLGTKANVAGASQYPQVGNPLVSVKGNVTAPGVRYYQTWYRNTVAFCTPSGFNLTNGVAITWAP